MPIYEYRCNPCGHQFEAQQRMADAPLTECQVCGGEVSRVLFAPAIHFKGTGFHNTDYGTRRRPLGGEEGGGSGEAGGDRGEGNKGEKGDKGTGETGKKAAGDSAGAAKETSSSGKSVGLDKV